VVHVQFLISRNDELRLNAERNGHPMPELKERQERMTYMTLVGFFLALLGALAFREKDRHHGFDLSSRDLTLLGLATFRGARIVAYDRVAEPFRAPVTETVPDEYNAGENVVAEGSGVQKAIGELVSCPTCVGTWIAAGLVYGLRFFPGPTRLCAAILGVSGLAELFSAVSETLTWLAQAARKRSAV
jgi:hypothetical protein